MFHHTQLSNARKNRKPPVSCLTLAAVLIICLALAAPASAASGNWTDPGNYNTSWLGNYDTTNAWTITDAQDLAALAVASASGKNFSGKTITVTTASIDLSPHAWVSIGQDITDPDYEFSGTFDGGNCIISNLTFPITIFNGQSSGLFGHANNSVISNVCLTNVSISRNSAKIAGTLLGSGRNVRIENCSADGMIYAEGEDLGGLIGSASCDSSDISRTLVKNCSANVTVLANETARAGGLISFFTGIMENCYAGGSVTGLSMNSGGLVGQSQKAIINNSYAAGNIRIVCPDPSIGMMIAGGLVGLSLEGTIDHCYAAGNVELSGSLPAQTWSGGLVGTLGVETTPVSSLLLQNSVALGQYINCTSPDTGRILGGVVNVNTGDPITDYTGIVADCAGWKGTTNGQNRFTPDTGSKTNNGTAIPVTEFWNAAPGTAGNVWNGWDTGIWELKTGFTHYLLPTFRYQTTVPAFSTRYSDEPDPPHPTVTPSPVSGDGSGNMENAFRVIFDTSGGSFIQPETGLSYGDSVTRPTTPEKDGFSFDGWYRDESCTNPWNFSDTIPGDITLYAKWISTTAATLVPTTAISPSLASQTTTAPTGASATAIAPVPTASAATGGTTTVPTMAQAPMPVAGLLLGLLAAAGILIRRRE